MKVSYSVFISLASTRVINRVSEYVDKLGIIFVPLFFAIIGAQVDLRGINLNVLLLAGGIVAVAILTKLVGCGLPSMLFLKDKSKAMKVGIGMVSRGEVGLIVAGVGVSSKILSIRCLYCDNNYGCPYNSCNSYLAEKSISKGKNPRTCLTFY